MEVRPHRQVIELAELLKACDAAGVTRLASAGGIRSLRPRSAHHAIRSKVSPLTMRATSFGDAAAVAAEHRDLAKRSLSASGWSPDVEDLAHWRIATK